MIFNFEVWCFMDNTPLFIGYLISFCFTVDFAVRTRYLYGFVSVVGWFLYNIKALKCFLD